MQFLTDFADMAVILPLCACVATGFAWAGWRRGARGWLVAMAATLGTMLVLKLVALGCPTVGRGFSASGHTAAGAFAYGGLAALWLQRPLGRWAGIVCGGLAAATIGVTRLVLHLHGVSEVMAGGAVGVAGVWLLLRLAGPVPDGLRLRLPAAACLVVLFLAHGERLPIELKLQEIVAWLHRGSCHPA